jgi:hypothetical protein
LLFFVRAVGLTMEFIIISSRPPPICLTIKVLIHGNFLSFGNPNNGLVNMHPLIFNSLLYINNLVATKAPKLCAYKNRGKSSLACFKSKMTSFYSFYIVAHPLGAPEYPNPLKSTRRTSKFFLAK